MGHYSFTASVVEELVQAGFERDVARRLVERLFLGPTATPKDVFAVARSVLSEREAYSAEVANARPRTPRPSTLPPPG